MVLPDDVAALADRGDLHAVRDDLDDPVVVIAAQVGGYLAVQAGSVGEVQRDQGEIALGDVVGVDGRVAGAGDAGGGGRSPGVGAGGKGDVAGAGPPLPLGAGGQVVLGDGGILDQEGSGAVVGQRAEDRDEVGRVRPAGGEGPGLGEAEGGREDQRDHARPAAYGAAPAGRCGRDEPVDRIPGGDGGEPGAP